MTRFRDWLLVLTAYMNEAMGGLAFDSPGTIRGKLNDGR